MSFAWDVAGVNLPTAGPQWHGLLGAIWLLRSQSLASFIHLYGSVSKPCTPGEPQNSW